jgi:hypothetical protein
VSFLSPYPHGADLGVYPTIDAMRSAYLDARYRDYPRAAHVPLGPWPQWIAREDARSGADFADTRIRAHAVVVVPGKTVLLRFARRTSLAGIERLVEERGLIAATPELDALRALPVEARLVYCDAFDGIEDAATMHGVRMVLYSPRLLLRWRDRAGRLPGEGVHARNFDPRALRSYVAMHPRRGVRERASGG